MDGYQLSENVVLPPACYDDNGSVPNDDSLEIDPTAFGPIQIHFATDLYNESTTASNAREETFLRNAISKALMVFTVERVQNEMKVLLKRLFDRRDIQGFDEANVVQGFTCALFLRPFIIGCGSVKDSRHLFDTNPRWMGSAECPAGYIVFNKAYITDFARHFEAVGKDTRGQIQLYMAIAVATVHACAQILAYNALVDGLRSRDWQGQDPLQVIKELSSRPDMGFDYLRFADDLVQGLFEGQIGFYQVHKRTNPAGWMLVKVRTSSSDKTKLMRISEDFLKSLIIEGKWERLDFKRQPGDVGDALFLMPSPGSCTLGPWRPAGNGKQSATE